jgi:hypothetical protein
MRCIWLRCETEQGALGPGRGCSNVHTRSCDEKELLAINPNCDAEPPSYSGLTAALLNGVTSLVIPSFLPGCSIAPPLSRSRAPAIACTITPISFPTTSDQTHPLTRHPHQDGAAGHQRRILIHPMADHSQFDRSIIVAKPTSTFYITSSRAAGT